MKTPHLNDRKHPISRILVAVFFVTLIIANSLQAASPVWKISKMSSMGEEQVVYLAGTIHLLGESDYPLPKGYETAYQKADIVAFEIDLRETQTPSFQQHFLMQMRYPYGETLKLHLKASTYLKLKKHLRERGVDIKNFDHYKVGYVSMNLTVLELQKLGMAGTGVDQYFTEKAIADGKPILSLETTDEHFEYIANLGQGRENDYIKYSLKEIKDLPEMLATTKRHWRNGDLAGFEKDILQPMQEAFPQAVDSLLVERNQNWLPQIEEMLKTDKVELVMVGNLHLASDEGLIALLQAKGYQVSQLP